MICFLYYDCIVLHVHYTLYYILLWIGCGENWTKSGQMCYMYRGQPTMWHNAESDCVRLGGHLASIHGNREEDHTNEYLR